MEGQDLLIMMMNLQAHSHQMQIFCPNLFKKNRQLLASLTPKQFFQKQINQHLTSTDP